METNKCKTDLLGFLGFLMPIKKEKKKRTEIYDTRFETGELKFLMNFFYSSRIKISS